jgi:LacI family transcriptional regulator
MDGGLINVEVFLGAAPLLELRLVEGLLAFGDTHPQWRFSLRGPDVRYTPEWLEQQKVRGALVLVSADSVAPALDAAGIPWVHLLPPEPQSHPAVTVDDHAIGRMGAEMYLDCGFRKFAFCGVDTPWSAVRGRGFRERLMEEELDCEMLDIRFDTGTRWTLAAGADETLRDWLSRLKRVTAIMAGHDALANRLADLCRQEGIRVPDDLAILGVGNHELLCRLSPPPISSIDCAVPEVAKRGAELLEAMLLKHSYPPGITVAPRRVVARHSTDVLGFENDLINRMVRHIRDHACDGLTAEALARRFPVSRRTLSRRFQEYVGHPPGEEIRRTRLRQARRLLTETDLSLTEIAMACGFADLSHMDRSFRSALGITPGSVRQGL